MNGVLNINKPSGMTSHDVVLSVRRLLGEKRIGHTGTLDPLATGVLVLCVGKATRIARFLEAGEKEYRAVMRLGVITDTLDSQGKIVETRAYDAPDRARVLAALRNFTGSIVQRPPAYSAVKVKGVPSYKLARRGSAEPLPPRAVTIFDISLADYQDPCITISVRCSKGVYIRTLCADLGEALGAGAHLTSLVRTRSGRFTLDGAVTLEQLARLSREGGLGGLMVPIDIALDDVPAVVLSPDESEKIAQGRRVAHSEALDDKAGCLVRVHGQGGLVALARMGNGELVPEIVFSSI